MSLNISKRIMLYDMMWCDVMWCGVVWCVVWCGVMWCDVMWCDVIWYDMIWYLTWYLIWYLIWYDNERKPFCKDIFKLIRYEICFNQQWSSIGSDNGLVPNILKKRSRAFATLRDLTIRIIMPFWIGPHDAVCANDVSLFYGSLLLWHSMKLIDSM